MGKLHKQSSGVGNYLKYRKGKLTGGDLPDNHQHQKVAICPNCGAGWGKLSVSTHIKCRECGNVWEQTATV